MKHITFCTFTRTSCFGLFSNRPEANKLDRRIKRTNYENYEIKFIANMGNILSNIPRPEIKSKFEEKFQMENITKYYIDLNENRLN